MNNSLSNIQWQEGESLFNNSFKKGMSAADGFRILNLLIDGLYKGQSLSCLDLNEFGITCKDDDEAGLMCQVLNVLLANQKQIAERITAISKANTTVQAAATAISDEKVKASRDSKVAGYLIDLLVGTAGRIKYNSDKDVVVVSGLLPVGARMFISPSRLSDIGADGKGKIGTDLEGWVLRDGRNNTDNAMGFFPMYTDILDNAGKKIGNNNVTIDITNIKSFKFAITGDIKSSLNTPLVVEVPFATVQKHFGITSSRDVLIPDDIISGYKKSKPLDASHTHAHTLGAGWDNPQPTAIDITPSSIKEIPIEFKGL